MIMKDTMLLIWYYIEVKAVQLLRLFGVRRSAKHIPSGMYCYDHDDNGKYLGCKYSRWTKKTRTIACTYIGYYGFDPCLYDQCKICGENDDFENE